MFNNTEFAVKQSFKLPLPKQGESEVTTMKTIIQYAEDVLLDQAIVDFTLALRSKPLDVELIEKKAQEVWYCCSTTVGALQRLTKGMKEVHTNSESMTRATQTASIADQPVMLLEGEVIASNETGAVSKIKLNGTSPPETPSFAMVEENKKDEEERDSEIAFEKEPPSIDNILQFAYNLDSPEPNPSDLFSQTPSDKKQSTPGKRRIFTRATPF